MESFFLSETCKYLYLVCVPRGGPGRRPGPRGAGVGSAPVPRALTGHRSAPDVALAPDPEGWAGVAVTPAWRARHQQMSRHRVHEAETVGGGPRWRCGRGGFSRMAAGSVAHVTAASPAGQLAPWPHACSHACGGEILDLERA